MTDQRAAAEAKALGWLTWMQPGEWRGSWWLPVHLESLSDLLLAWGEERDAQVARLTEENEKLRWDMVTLAQNMHARELDGYREREAEAERLRSQLPEQMQGCTIRFIECPQGHGRLTATNWLDHGCLACEAERLRAELAKQQIETSVRDSTITALRAELAQVKGEVETANRGIDLQREQIRFLDSEVERKDRALWEIAQDARRRCLEDHPEFADGTEAVPHELVCSSARLEIGAELAVRPALSPVAPCSACEGTPQSHAAGSPCPRAVAPAETPKRDDIGLKLAAMATCSACARGNDSAYRNPNRIKPGPDDWWHENAIRCNAGKILDLISPLPEAPHASKPKPASFVAAGDGEACRIVGPETSTPTTEEG